MAELFLGHFILSFVAINQVILFYNLF